MPLQLRPLQLTVYVAGKVDGPKHRVIEHAKEPGIEFLSTGDDRHCLHGGGRGYYPNFLECRSASIVLQAIDYLSRSDMLFAYLDSPDSFGTIAEIAYMSTTGRPSLVTVRMEGSDICRSDMFDAYWFVCSFPGVIVQAVEGEFHARAVLMNYIETFRRGFFSGTTATTEKAIQQLSTSKK